MASTPARLLPSNQLTIREALEFNSQHNPQSPFYVFSRAHGQPNTILTHLEFFRASHRAATMLLRSVVRGEKDRGRVVAIVANLDAVTYSVITAGLMVAGLVPFPISPRFPSAAVAHLLKKTSSHWMITTQGTLHGLPDDVKADLCASDPAYELLVTESPSYLELFSERGLEDFEPHPSPPSYHLSDDDNVLYLHSSGSTGLPKAIPMSRRYMAEQASCDIATSLSRAPYPILMSSIGLPSFHALGIYTQLFSPVFGLVTVTMFPPAVLSPTDLPIATTPDNILDHLRRTQSNSMFMLPAILHAWAQSESTVDFLKGLAWIGFGGGPLGKKVGDYLAASGLNIQSVYGGTEFGCSTTVRLMRGHEADWEWMEFSSKLNVRWVDEGNGKYECQFLTSDNHHPALENMQNPRGYATSDLFERHPTQPNWWKIVGRKDDVIIHSSGEKTVPGPMEETMGSSPLVAGVVMFGREHDQAGVLIEPAPEHAVDPDDFHQLATWRNSLWPVIEEANHGAPAFSRIFKEMILVTSITKPLPRSAKGAVVRKQALALYAEEIENLYKSVETSKGGQDVAPPDNWEESAVRSWILDQARDISSLGDDIDPSRDLFDQGFDSLSATFLRLRIAGAITSSDVPQVAANALEQNVVYNYPTVDSLANFVLRIVRDPTNTDQVHQVTDIEQMIKKYSSGLDAPLPLSSVPHGEHGTVVLITGTTGNIGAEILAAMLENQKVKKIYALNRRSSNSQTSLTRHKSRFEDKGLDIGLLGLPKLVFVEGDPAEELLGLDPYVYEELLGSLNMIIHVAWRLDFNLNLASFESNVRGTRRLIDLARSSQQVSSFRFLFTASVGAAQSWDRTKGLYPEEVVADARYAVGAGYGASKYISERIIAQSGLNACILRIGQVTGGLPKGAWATTDWVPILVKSSLALGVLPILPGVVSWIPMNVVCGAIVEIALGNERMPLVMNLVHPRGSPGDQIMKAIQSALGKEVGADLRLASMEEWLSLLEVKAKDGTEEVLRDIPAIKLLNFFQNLASRSEADGGEDSEGFGSFSTETAQKKSVAMRTASRIGLLDVARWVRYWNGRGFL